jgi:DNA-binding winged helix-turn-helix (wHTH) protein
MAEQNGTNGTHFTPQELRILAVLADGEAHHRDELFAKCVDDQLSSPVALAMSISRLRKKLESRGEMILCAVNGKRQFEYRHVVLLRPVLS